jgi:hypothetical protein
MGAMREISKSDIYGDIKGFPLEVVQKMVELTMKEKHVNLEEALQILRNSAWRGFTWAETNEGNMFWYKVINRHEWWRFYERYPVNLSSPIRYAVVKEDSDGCFPEEIFGYLGDVPQLSGKGKIGDIYFAYPSIYGFRVGFAIKDSPRYKRIIKNGIEL